MKHILATILIVLVFGCKGNAQIKEFYSDSLCIMKIVDNRAVCYLMCMGENQKLNYYFDCKKIMPVPKPSPLPDTTKPLNIKMQPRWRSDDTIYVQSIPYYINDSTFIVDTSGRDGWLTKAQYDSFMMKVDNNYYKIDTTKCLLLVSDTSSINGFKSSRCWYIEGYSVFYFPSGEWKVGVSNYHYEYLDASKSPLKKNFIVWMSKEVKQ